jgi:AraC family transcriptional regulator
MYTEQRSADIGSALIIEGLAKQVSAEIVRRLSQCVAAEGRRTGGLPPWRLRLIERRAREDAALPSLDELAALCQISIRHLSRAFRRETGQTIGKFLERIMIERAKAMLLAGVAVGQVARSLGYARPGNFAHAFRRATGMLPTEVIQQRPVGPVGPAEPVN